MPAELPSTEQIFTEPNRSVPLLYSGRLIIGRIFASEIWGLTYYCYFHPWFLFWFLQIEVSEMYFVPDPDASNEQCEIPMFKPVSNDF